MVLRSFNRSVVAGFSVVKVADVSVDVIILVVRRGTSSNGIYVAFLLIFTALVDMFMEFQY
jgi:hypothetical protein